jgi:hypothetical protein
MGAPWVVAGQGPVAVVGCGSAGSAPSLLDQSLRTSQWVGHAVRCRISVVGVGTRVEATATAPVLVT